MQAAPSASFVTHAASGTPTTNHPSVTGVSPASNRSSRASSTMLIRLPDARPAPSPTLSTTMCPSVCPDYGSGSALDHGSHSAGEMNPHPAAGSRPDAVVLVEGISDQRALEALAERRGRDLAAESVSVVPIGGAQAIGRFLRTYGPAGLGLRLAGLCDEGEELHFRRALEHAGLGSHLTRSGMEALGFYVCVADLEEELIRALGPAAVERVVDAQGDLESFRTFQKQPAWRERPTEEQLRRFLGTTSGRKIQSAALLVHALDLTRVPWPLEGVLAHV
jgi:hypothetical protein